MFKHTFNLFFCLLVHRLAVGIRLPFCILYKSGADLGGGCRGCAPPPPWDDLRFSNTTGILQKKTMWFIGVEVEQETSAPPPKKNPGSAPANCFCTDPGLRQLWNPETLNGLSLWNWCYLIKGTHICTPKLPRNKQMFRRNFILR